MWARSYPSELYLRSEDIALSRYESGHEPERYGLVRKCIKDRRPNRPLVNSNIMLQHPIISVAPQIGRRVGYYALLGTLGSTVPRRSLSSSSVLLNGLTDRKAAAAAVGLHQRLYRFLVNEVVALLTPCQVIHLWFLSPLLIMVTGFSFTPSTLPKSSELSRWGFDLVSGYKHKTIPPGASLTLEQLRKEGYVLDEKQWLQASWTLLVFEMSDLISAQRILFLESIAGVPGMVAATARHLQSLRLFRRDNGWCVTATAFGNQDSHVVRIHTCLEEAENERMHLMTFMTLRNPSIFFRGLILGAQGVFYNLFFITYLFAPRACHRFVGYLEEEAVLTYTKCIKEIERGNVPEWSDMAAPQIAVDYWRLPSDAKLLDVIYAVRSDETTHRFVNHSLANLDVKSDVNPFALKEPDMHTKGKKIAKLSARAQRTDVMGTRLSFTLPMGSPPAVRIISSSSVATPSASKLDDPVPQIHRRVFIGPMPQKVLSIPGETKKSNKRKHNSSQTDSDEQIRQIISHYARNVSLHDIGEGEPEGSDWGENEEQSAREEMYRRWKESEWGVALRQLRSRSGASKKSIANNFEIGSIAGINIIAEAETLSRVSSRSSAQQTTPFFPLDSVLESLGNSKSSGPFSEQQTQAQTFATAPTEPAGSNKSQAISSPTPALSSQNISIADDYINHTESPSSSTALLRPTTSPQHGSGPSRTQSGPARRPIMKLTSLSSLPAVGDSFSQGKKTVRYALSPVESDHSLPPASPTEVLERSGTDVTGTSAGSMSVAASDDSQILGNDIMRDRMFVRAYSTDAVNLLARFDESIHRGTAELGFEGWVWRKDYLEIYENYDIGMKEWFTQHKKLAFIIPLKDSRTRLSLYSFVDLTFCVTCSPTSRRFNPVKAKWSIHSSKEGLNIFIFNVKTRSRAFDWIWRLWRFLSGILPPIVEIGVPRLDTKLKIDMPNIDNIQTYKVFSKDNLIALSTQSLRAVSDWNFLVERQLAAGNTLQLCWRQGSYLDWIWLDDDVQGQPRDWAVLCGLALKQLSAPVQLELRMAEHRYAFVHLKDRSRFYEPPAIEGYVDRIKPNTNTKQSLYLVTHEGNLYVLHPSNPHPPMPFGAAPEPVGPGVDYAQELQMSEVRRGIRQLSDATGVVDLRSILAVRRAEHPVMQITHDIKVVTEERKEEEEERRPRLNNRAYSCMFNLEWITKLQALVKYWKRKHRNDAKEEMRLAQTVRPLVTPYIHSEVYKATYAEPPVDPTSPLPALGSLFNWCALDGCKPVIKSGKVFMKKGLHSQYWLMDLVLVPEHLLQFRITPKSVLHASTRTKIHLADAYVCSGFLAAQMLPPGQFNPSANSVPRKYQDGLETDDPEEDRLFVILYRKTPSPVGEEDTTASGTDSSANISSVSHPAKTTEPGIAPLNAKRKIAIFRTRSRLERDAWCWALKSSIEKVVRARKDREQKMRESGGLMDL
ncbi:hypothetical protein D9757_003483 [Collybiopsis confluens]|uniref:Alternative oxidase n=1 Tax=Collybiopsis confluens TaxID=2823264 RepID=A0A8H5HTG9_9AGAR|nr:hypothetical protein D9757_003483 [Collybiopsis confluens]